jgi:hypothetical protein
MTGNTVQLVVEDLEFLDDGGGTGHRLFEAENLTPTFNRCSFHGTILVAGHTPVFNACRLDGGISTSTAMPRFCGTVFFGRFGIVGWWGSCFIGMDSVLQGCQLNTNIIPGANIIIDDCAIYDFAGATNGAVVAQQHGFVRLHAFFGGSHTLYGTGVAGYTLVIQHGGTVVYTDTASIKLAGGTSIIKIDGANKILTDLPIAVATSSNKMVLDS